MTGVVDSWTRTRKTTPIIFERGRIPNGVGRIVRVKDLSDQPTYTTNTEPLWTPERKDPVGGINRKVGVRPGVTEGV